MAKVRVYLDTSVFGGIKDEEFAEPTRRFFERVKRGEYMILFSLETLRELRRAPTEVRAVLEDLPEGCLERVAVDAEVEALARAYIGAGILSRASESDALHVAAASVARADLILSWNFQHIVNYERIHKYSGINELNGYPPIEIHSPLEMGDGGQDQDL